MGTFYNLNNPNCSVFINRYPRGILSYTHTAADQVQSYQVNADPVVSYDYYDDGSIRSITKSGDNPLFYYYTLSGQKAQILYPNNSRADYAYDNQGRLVSIVNRKPDASVLSSYTYGYDYDYTTNSYGMKGFRTSMTNYLSQMEKYYFDDLYQLTQVDYANGDVHQWSYDDIGNRVQQVVTPFGQGPVITDYTYYQNAQAMNSQLLQSDGINTYTWDNNGNLMAKGTTNYTWDYDDRLTGISGASVNASYVYDYMGRRTKKTVTGTETAYFYNGEDIVKETTGGVVADYLYGIGIDEPVMMDRAGVKSYYYRDGLGSIREMSDSAGTVQNSYTYGAWGEIRNQTTTLPNSYGFTGREFSEDGLYFYRSRYLDSNLGRFISEDPTEFEGGINFYVYVLNNPIEFIDPFGMFTYKDNTVGRLKGEALALANCMEKCMGISFVVTGGSEKTNHKKGSKHYTDQAFDMWPKGHDKDKVFCCALECGAKYALDEGNHWHFQTPKGRYGGRGDLPKKEDCECKIKK